MINPHFFTPPFQFLPHELGPFALITIEGMPYQDKMLTLKNFPSWNSGVESKAFASIHFEKYSIACVFCVIC